ncbi:CDP-alcohol phosphatidyltransferase family protein [Spongisporangium articulatum]|uniref:Phosphatidylcholine synthase n=1 Tax=Spongisporangium articulatum TaxID=3362603 RepID=A0ABW8AKQ0_9ACTN
MGVPLTTPDVASDAFDFSRPFRLAGLGVHLYTASGTVLAFLVVTAAIDGDAKRALWVSFAALIIDGTDGMLARRFRVKETIPSFDGAMLDNIVDYITYVFAPVVLLWTGGYLPSGTAGAALAFAPLLASSYQFCRVDAKTEDHFFLGFPSYWNVVAFYVVVMDLSVATTATILVVCSALVFVPLKYIYPSRTAALRRTNIAATAVWLVTYAVLLAQVPDPNGIVLGISFAYLAYYVGASLWLTMQRRRAPEATPRELEPAGQQ